ncbi:SDR family oxidoreductase [Rhodococcus qingshengii]|uniref:SDR family oxidoreductase n=1 Tax=Rhodococcus qingshengii TaxID=334542 RepID=UPI00237D280E|nr:SDR family oxidoreductase [Rhodococcus qingshengii]WCT06033.1 SDR family oxidoreductase [Rhodococcus qingshengii]
MSAETSGAKTVFVAGGTSGINRAIAEAYARQGHRVAVLSRSAEKVEDTVAVLSGHSSALGFVADVRDADAVGTALSNVHDLWGDIDILISGAAGNFVAPAESLSTNGFKSVIDIDLLGTFNVLRLAWPYLRKPGASILSISASTAWMPTKGQVHVGAAKAGIDQVTRTLALEWGQHGIRVNAIAPGPVADTEGMRRLAPTDDAVAGWTRAVPLGRFATTADIVSATQWLCSDAAGYVTGVILDVDGGLSLGGSSAINAAMQQ